MKVDSFSVKTSVKCTANMSWLTANKSCFWGLLLSHMFMLCIGANVGSTGITSSRRKPERRLPVAPPSVRLHGRNAALRSVIVGAQWAWHGHSVKTNWPLEQRFRLQQAGRVTSPQRALCSPVSWLWNGDGDGGLLLRGRLLPWVQSAYRTRLLPSHSGTCLCLRLSFSILGELFTFPKHLI